MRYANITSIPSSYIVAFFSSLGDASPPSEDASLYKMFVVPLTNSSILRIICGEYARYTPQIRLKSVHSS